MNICLYWSQVSSSWSNANWTWADCQLIQEVCQVWGTTGVWWTNANWQWSQCSASVPTPPTSSVVTIQPNGVDATTLIQPWLIQPWNPYKANDEIDKKRKRLIKLICKLKGQTYSEEKEVGSQDIDVDDIKMVVKKALNIDLDVKR